VKNYLKISLVIPYHNEGIEVIRTVKAVLRDNYLPKEIILVDSTSSDNTFNIVNKYLKSIKLKKIKIKNISKGSTLPSTSKNLGIKFSKYNLIAFLDCGVKMKINWLINQYLFLKKKKLDCVFGKCLFKPIDNLNISVILNTYGFKSKHSVLPSSLIKKEVFKQFGLFKSKRAGYDWHWINYVKKSKIKSATSDKVTLEYRNFVKNIMYLPKKIFLYSYNSCEFQPYFKQLIYLSAPIYFFLTTKYILVNFLLYFSLKFIQINRKSKINLKDLNIKILIYIPIIAMIIDISRSVGFYYNKLKKLWIF